MSSKKKILLFSGDPNSVNSEIIYKSWKVLSKSIRKKIYIISNFNLMKDQFKKLNFSSNIIKVKNIYEFSESDEMKILNIDLKFDNPFRVSKKLNSKFIYKALNYAHKLSLNDNIAGIINCPINKTLLKRKNSGLTEFFSQKCKIINDTEVMLITNDKFSVSPITTHLDIKDVAKKISKEIIFKKIKTINNYFTGKLNKKPKIGVLGLNPHNAELRSNSEEKKIIIPAIKKLKRSKINIEGPFSADTMFINGYKNYDVVVGMFHDQVITPFKTIFNFDAINLTLGLKYLRVSPDHGTAIDLIGKKKANPRSLIKCIKFLSKIY